MDSELRGVSPSFVSNLEVNLRTRPIEWVLYKQQCSVYVAKLTFWIVGWYSSWIWRDFVLWLWACPIWTKNLKGGLDIRLFCGGKQANLF
jgi:hypothetical protein